ncbi:hypothetical protein LLE49_21175 [Alicyclobacillus tolerans]|uniref:hypothetical protein n=1 Tax=Alicyclobacillus tolerans TaxID=90970 RepID=UPI001F4264CB|nr:hypothetical protein [Alicyclobacillus tolerans]MCF8567237.1 hypothetical protein [Alicyclobacillus tolerans]
MRSRGGDKKNVISAALRAIDIWSAILLLTGQVTVGGVFISSGAIWLSLTGPIFGGDRLNGKSVGANAVIDLIDVVTALLLILGQITNTGPWISSGRLNFVVSGPAFGNPNVPVAANPSETSERALLFFDEFRQVMIHREINPERRS